MSHVIRCVVDDCVGSSGRSFDALKKFVSEELEAKCDVNDTKDCTDKEKGFIEKRKGMDKAANAKETARSWLPPLLPPTREHF